MKNIDRVNSVCVKDVQIFYWVKKKRLVLGDLDIEKKTQQRQ